MVLPPGNILQNLYLKERARTNGWKSFFEIGSGNGYLSRELLDCGLEGAGCDLNESACQNNEAFNAAFISSGKYTVRHQDFLAYQTDKKYDVVLAAMVIEHLDADALAKFVSKMKSLVKENGTILFFVPASMAHWGIEDDIAGHFIRYERPDFEGFNERFGLRIHHIAGLTYPMSNWLLSISNRLIKKSESKMLEMSQKDRTVYTGNRNVPYKTTFPGWLKIVLNEVVMYPLHILQKMFLENKNALVLYTELK